MLTHFHVLRVCSIILVAAGAILTGCSKEPTVKELQAELAGIGAAFSAATAEKKSTVELEERHAKIKHKIMQMADSGDPIACATTAALKLLDGDVQASPPGIDRKKAAVEYREALRYAKCAVAKQEQLTESDKESMQKFLKRLPEIIASMEAG